MGEASSMRYPPPTVTSVTRRYADAYVIARTVEGFGATIKGIGIVIGALMVLGSIVAALESGALISLGGIVIAVAITAVLYLLGTLASAQGQILKATLDTAVNSSEFLSAHDRAQVMSIPYGAPRIVTVDEPHRAPVDWRCGCGQQNPADAPACLECGVGYGAA
jgi:hypothetical protein